MTVPSIKTKHLLVKLDKEFNNASKRLVAGAGMERDAVGRRHFEVFLEREPTSTEARKLPKEYDGAPIEYKVTGPLGKLGVR